MFKRRPLVNVDDAQARTRKRIPRSVYDLVIGESEDGHTVADNLQAFRDLKFIPKVGVTSAAPKQLSTTVLGCELAMPVVIAPAGVIRLVHHDAEMAAARAAGKFGIACGVSTMSSFAIEEICATTRAPIWYQIYPAGGRRAIEVAIDRAKAAGCKALLVTIDNPVAGYRESALLGRGLPTRVDLATLVSHFPELVMRPRWSLEYLRFTWGSGLQLPLPNVRLSREGPALGTEEATATRVGNPLVWDDVVWIKQRFGGKVAVKGVMRPEDARRALDCGADAVVISNHGGFITDSVPGTLRLLPEIVDAVGDRTEVLLDSGVRRGLDVVKALALGARAVLIGRAYVWALGAAGEAGVNEMLGIFRDGLERTLALVGCNDVRQLDASYVRWLRELPGA
jgi:isopentenyl diphosphate isomerase/L-lactate dehydrogenase-like FMN-dependent dehydrogenase